MFNWVEQFSYCISKMPINNSNLPVSPHTPVTSKELLGRSPLSEGRAMLVFQLVAELLVALGFLARLVLEDISYLVLIIIEGSSKSQFIHGS